MASPKVVVIGATGAHGQEIIKGLLESPTKFNTQKEMEEAMAKCKAKLDADPNDQDAEFELTVNQYFYSMGVRGDSTPEVADYLGYLDSRRLYPDVKPSTLREYYQTVLDGKEVNPYGSS
ncbi:hypothetical protein PpBr36_02061 [Pyricularia pennisetigena]|uniref:hypothetical protein n=1 Tax=Pyricularia pennisetigena TaxID=1578925 RepID=UPI00114F07D0|nr:hypothetical protein PpBr36_02061 [Pyricularia pennisetigena]TLS27893.1 hypothetical protein PpBr36_02061 [Pyricularia pennisetigena]